MADTNSSQQVVRRERADLETRVTMARAVLTATLIGVENDSPLIDRIVIDAIAAARELLET